MCENPTNHVHGEDTVAPIGEVGPFDVTPEEGLRAITQAGIRAVQAQQFFATSFRTNQWVHEINGPEFDELWETVTNQVAREFGYDSADDIPTTYGLGAQADNGHIVTEVRGVPVIVPASGVPNLALFDLYDHLAQDQAA